MPASSVLDHVHIRYRVTDCLSAESLKVSRSLLSSDELARHDRFVFDRDRRDYAAAHGLLRTTLSRFAKTPPTAWRFVNNAHGKPSIAGDVERGLSFNLSHTHGLVACVIASFADVGIDVECADRTIGSRDIAARYFASSELAALDRCPPEEREARFIEFWTLKEAYIKAVGVGLSHPLDEIPFCLEDRGRIEFLRRDSNNWPLWRFALFAPTPSHRMAVAVRGGPEPPGRIVAVSDDQSASALAPLGESSS